MKKLLLSVAVVASIIACKPESKPAQEVPVETATDTLKQDTIVYVAPEGQLLAMNDSYSQDPKYASFGKKITADRAIKASDLLKKFEKMKTGDTISVKFQGKVTSVCKKKGCWMKVDLGKDKETFVRFEDYGFFVPLNADNTMAIMNGKAYIDEVSVAELKHYAKDGGKSQAEIDAIKTPKRTYAFLADGVLMQK